MIASLLFRLSYRRFLRACRTPLAAQARCLRRVLGQAAATDAGRTHDFARIARLKGDAELIAAYQGRVPIRPYRDMGADLEAVYAGDWRRLCPSRPIYFAMTAGSTGRFKYLPVTRELRGDLGAASLIYYGALEAACPALRGLKAQFLVGSAEGGSSPDGIPQGFASGFNYKNLPRFLRAKFLLPYWIFTLGDVDDRAYAAGRILAEHDDVGALCAISPVNLLNLKTALEENVDRLCADLRAGTLTVQSRPAVAGQYRGRPNPRRAQVLEDAWRRSETLPMELLFPALRTLVCWQSGNMRYYLDELTDRFGGPDLFEFPLSASEGLFAIPFRKNVAGGIAAVTSHFLEFLPADAPPPGGAAAALCADALQVGAHYRLVITTSGGLYRYDMEDVVRVTGFHERTPILTFVSRANGQVSVANERLTESDVTEAMASATRRLGIRVREFLFVPCSDRRYRVLVDGRAQIDLPAFAGELERQLRAAATGYDFEREDALLQPLELVCTRPNELRAYLNQGGGPAALPNAQIKPAHLTREFDAHTRFAAIETHAA
jgi:hypothetical protein